MRVYYTVDVELWPQNPAQPEFNGLDEDYRRDVYGLTRDGEYGVRYQMDALEAEGLTGVFFIEAAHALKAGNVYLRDMIQTVTSRGHEAALHIHTEWLEWLDDHPLGGRNGLNLNSFSYSDQHWMVARTMQLAAECGLTRITSFRAGNFGADRNSLRALAHHGVVFDSSYNAVTKNSQCAIKTDRLLTKPHRMEGLVEVPVTFVQDYPQHYRPMQVMAASFNEMRCALDVSHRRGFPSFVIVSHGFELIRRRREIRGGARVDSIVATRFERLMKHLGRNKDRFRVTTFADTAPEQLLCDMPDDTPVQGSVIRTFGRVMGQALRRLHC